MRKLVMVFGILLILSFSGCLETSSEEQFIEKNSDFISLSKKIDADLENAARALDSKDHGMALPHIDSTDSRLIYANGIIGELRGMIYDEKSREIVQLNDEQWHVQRKISQNYRTMLEALETENLETYETFSQETRDLIHRKNSIIGKSNALFEELKKF